MTCSWSQRRQAFTLVEILIVVVILGILAAIVVPQFVSAAESSRASALDTTLQRVRTQIEIYTQQHEGTPPTLADFEEQMTLASDVTGDTATVGTAGFSFGPYLTQLPTNPHTDGQTIGSGAVGTSDWYYDEITGEFRANDTDANRLR
jgi:general secretion pathway protein G